VRAVLQRVSRAAVRVDGAVTGEIGTGLVVLLGIGRGDTLADVEFLVDRVVGLRIFADPEGKMNLNLDQAGGALLVVSQFTLYADTKKGRRPSFLDAAPPDEAIPLYERFLELARARNVVVETGVFAAMMEVELVNDGPVTIVIDSPA